MRNIFILMTEDREIIGAAFEWETIVNAAEDYAASHEAFIPGKARLQSTMFGDYWTLFCEYVNQDEPFIAIEHGFDMWIEKIPFFAAGTKFAVDHINIEIPAFLRPQAE